MGPFVVRRLLTVVAIIPVITLLVFLMRVLVPGDLMEIMFMGQFDRPRDDRARAAGARLGPSAVRPVRGVRRPARPGGSRRSIQNNRHVAEDLRARYPLTLLLAVASLVLATTLGLGLRLVAALQRERLLDAVATALAVVGISMPPFWLGLLLIGLVSVRWGLLPVMGADSWRRLVLPAVTLGTLSAAAIARLVRSSLLETLGRTSSAPRGPRGCPVISSSPSTPSAQR